MSQQCCTLLRGRVILTPALKPSGVGWGSLWGIEYGGGAATPLQMPPGRFIGNSSALTITPTYQTFETIDYTGEGGPACAGADLQNIAVSINMKCQSPENLALALFGTQCTTGAPSVVLNELIPVSGSTIQCNDSIFFGQPLVDLDQNVALQLDGPTGSQSLNAGVDFQKTAVGVRMLRDLSVDSLTTLRASYTTQAGAQHIEAATRDSIDVGVVYEGIEKLTQRAVIAQIYRLRLVNSSAFDLINQQPGELNLSGQLLPVCSPANRSRFWRMMMQPQTQGCC